MPPPFVAEGLAGELPELGDTLRQLVSVLHDLAQMRDAIGSQDVIGVDLLQIDAQGAAELDLGPDSCRTVAVVNYTGAAVVVAGASRQTSIPLVGPNVFTVGAAAFLQVPVLSSNIVIYGTPLGSVLLVRYSSVKPVAGGLVGTPPPAGLATSVPVANPAPGADFILGPVPAGQLWTVQSLEATLTDSAAVANRIPFYIVHDGTGAVAQLNLAAAALTASQTLTATAMAGGAQSFTGVAPNFFTTVPLPSGLLLPAGWSIRSVTVAIQAADQWSAIRAAVQVTNLAAPSPFL